MWHPVYALAISIVFAAAVGSFLIGPEAGRFSIFIFVYLATVAGLLGATVVFREIGWLAFLCVLVMLGIAVTMPFSAFEYVATGVLR